jgi:hypothetical protein
LRDADQVFDELGAAGVIDPDDSVRTTASIFSG